MTTVEDVWLSLITLTKEDAELHSAPTVCRIDCGRDAHGHVAACQHNTQNRSVWAPDRARELEFFAEVQRIRKTRVIRLFLDTLPEETRAQVVAAVSDALKANNIQL